MEDLKKEKNNDRKELLNKLKAHNSKLYGVELSNSERVLCIEALEMVITLKGVLEENEILAVKENVNTDKILNPAGEYAVLFARNHGMSIAEAMEHPMVKARFEYYSMTGA